MNTKFFRFFPIVLATILIVGAVFNTNAKKRSTKAKSVASIVQDISNLESFSVTSYDDCKILKGKIESLAIPCFKRSMDKSAVTKVQKTKAVLSQLDEYAAQNLESASNVEMASSGYIHKMSNSYFTFDTYDQMLSSAPSSKVRDAIKGEIDAWILLQNALQDYCTNASYLTSCGGSMALLGASGSGWTLSQIRNNDIGELSRIGMKAASSKLSMGNMDIATEIIQEMAKNAKGMKEAVDDDFKKSQPDYYNTFSNGISDAVKKVTEVLPKWLEARKNMLQYSANPKEAVDATKSFLEDIKKISSDEI